MEKKTKRVISREDYLKLKSYRDVYELFIQYLEILEFKALNITQELDKNGKLMLGNYTADMLNCQDEVGIRQCLDLMGIEGIEVEKENKVVENKKDMGKVGKKKFKSGSWAKNNELDKPKEVIDGPHLHSYVDDFKTDSDNVKLFLDQEELAEIMKIGMDDNSGAMG